MEKKLAELAMKASQATHVLPLDERGDIAASDFSQGPSLEYVDESSLDSPAAVQQSPNSPYAVNTTGNLESDPFLAKKKFRIRTLRVLALGLSVLLVLAFVFWLRSYYASQGSITPAYQTTSTPLEDLSQIDSNTLANASRLDINGQLRVNDSAVLLPTEPPENPVAGQLYFDQASNRVAYFNGTEFIFLEQSQDGVIGADGQDGQEGQNGATGATGSSGRDGQNGATGATGPQGSQGPQGPSGSATCPNGNCLSLQLASPGVSETGNINISGIAIASSFQGSGQFLTSLNGSNISSGTVSNAYLVNDGQLSVTAGVGLTGGGSVALGDNVNIGLADTAVSPGVYGSANEVAQITVDAQGRITSAASIAVSGLDTCSSCVSLQGATPGTSQTGHINITGTVIAGFFSGNGSSLTNVDAITLGGQNSSFYRDADNINAGILNDARLSANVTLQGNTFNGASQLVQLNASGHLPGLNAQNLTDLDASNIATGTVANARLVGSGSLTVSAGTGLTGGGIVALGGSTTVNLSDTTVTPTGYGSASEVATFTVDAQGRLTAASSASIAIAGTQITSGTISDARLSSNVALYNRATSNFTGSLQQGGSDVCTVGGNCAGVGGTGDITGTGNAGRLAIFDGAKNITDSWLLQNISTLELDDTRNLSLLGGNLTLANGNLDVTGTGYFTGVVTLGTQASTTAHAVRADRILTAGAGLAGGGNLTADRSFSIGQGNGIIVNADDVTLALEANKGLEVDGSGLSLINCAQDEILKYNASNQWVCSVDAGGSGIGDDIRVNGSNADGANFIDTASSGTVAATTWSLNTVTNPDEVSLTIGTASASEAGILTAGTQTLGGAKTFNGAITAGAGISLGTQTLQGTTAAIDFNNFDVSSAGAVTAVGVNAGSGLLQGTGGITVAGTVTLSSLTNGFLEVNGSGVASVGTIDLGTDTAGNYVATITPGNGISGTSSSEGGTPTIALANLTADWLQSGAFDITLDNSASELKIRESAGAFYAILDVADLSGDQTFTLNEGGTVVTTGNVSTHATTAVTAGTGLTGGGTTGALTLNIGAGNGVTVNANDITLALQANKGLEVDGNGLSLVDCADGQILKYETTGNTWACDADGAGSGVTTVGAIDSQAKSANGAVISGNSIHLQTADASFAGLVSTDAQTFAGDKTFANDLEIQGGSLIIGLASTNTGSITLNNSVNANTVTLQSGTTGTSYTLTLPSTVALADQCLKAADGTGTLVWDDCLGGGGGGLTSIDGQTGPAVTINNATGAGNAITIDNAVADGSTKGIAAFNGTNFSASSGIVNTIQNINTAASPQFTNLTLTADLDVQGGTATIGTNALAGNLILHEGDGNTADLVVGVQSGNQTYTLVQGGTVLTSGNVAANAVTTVTAGTGLTGGGGPGSITLNIGAGNGVTVNANDITLALQSDKGLEVDGDGLSLIDCADGQILKYETTGGTWACDTDGAGSGVTAVGTLDSQAKSADGAVISSNTIYLQTADATNPGLVSTGSQTFGGDKTFNGLVTGNAGLTVSGAAANINVSGTSGTSIGNSTGALTLTGSGASTIVFNGTTLTATELNRLDGKDAALVDTNDAVNTAITGTGALDSGSITSGFGSIALGADSLQGGSLTLGVASSTNGSIVFANGTNANTVTLQSGVTTASYSLTLPTAAGTQFQCLKYDTVGQLIWDDCEGGSGGASVTSLNGQTGAVNLNNATGAAGAVTIDNAAADGATKGIAAFNATNFSAVAGVVNTIQNINTAAAPQFAGLTLTGNLSIGANSIVTSGATISSTELDRLDGKDAALVDTNDAVNTAITGTGALNAGSITSGFGSIDTGADNIITTGAIRGGTVNATTSINTGAGAGTQRIDASGNLVNIGNITGTSAVSIASGGIAQNLSLDGSTTGQVLIGGASTGNILFGGGSGSTGCTVTNSNGNFDCTGTINGATLSGGTLTATAVNSLNVSATAISGTGALTIDANGVNTVSIGGISTGDVLLAGGNAATGCTVSNATGNLTCTGDITGAATGTVGYWSRAGSILQPSTAGDDITTSGDISTSGSGTITAAGLITGNAGLTISGAAASINVSGTSDTSIGNATGTVTVIGDSGSTIVLDGTTLTATELNRLDGKDAALVDTNDAVNTAITGTGALGSGSITSGFGSIDVGSDSIAGGNITVNGSQFTNNGSTLNTSQTLGNFATGGNIGAASTTVDVDTSFSVAQTTGGQTLSLPDPTDDTAGRLVFVLNTGSTSFTMHSVTIPAGYGQIYVWNGTAWILGASGGGSAITLQSAYDGGNTLVSSDARDIDFTLANTTTDANFTIDIASGSTGEFQIESNGTDILQIGAAGQLQLDVQGSSGGILLGGDAQFYRSNTNEITTPDSLVVQSTLSVSGDLLFDASSSIGWGGDTFLWRSAANTLQTNSDIVGSSLWVNNNIHAGGDADIDGDITLGTTSEIVWDSDTNLYRSDANELTTDDDFVVGGTASLGVQATATSHAVRADRALTAGTGLTGGGNLTADRTFNIGQGDGITANADDIAVDATVCRTSGNCAGVGGTGDILQGGNSFGVGGVTIGTNDNHPLSFETGGITRATIDTNGQLQLVTQGSTGGLLIGGDTNLYRSAANILQTDDAFVSASTITGTTLNGTTGINTGAGAGTQRIDASGNLVNIGNITGTSAVAIASGGIAQNLTINGSTTGQVQVGGTSTGDILFGGGSGSTGCTVTNSNGNLTCSGTINGATLSGGTLTAGAVNSLNVSGTAISGTGALTVDANGANTVSIGGTSTGDILFGGGSGSTGCTVTNSTGAFACSGNITGPSTGTIGYWSRGGTTLQPATAGDAITTSGNISTTGSGTITAAGILNVNATGKTAITIADSGAQSSGITIGGDTNLYRSNANELTTDDSLVVQGTMSVTGDVSLNSASDIVWGGDTNLYRLSANILATDDRILVSRGLDTDIAFDARITGDNAPRFQAQAGGKLLFGDGTSAADTNLYRESANTLATDSNFAVYEDIFAHDDLIVDDELRFGGSQDTILYSSSANTLSMGPNDEFRVINAGGENLRLVADTNSTFISAANDDTGDWLLTGELLGDAENRFTLETDGYMEWGDGTNPEDTNLYRSAANLLATDDTFEALAFRANGSAGSSVTCAGGQFLQNQVVVGGIVTGGSCASAGGGSGDVLQGGNSFTGAMTIGTNDTFDLNFETDGTTRVTIDTSGDTTFNGHVLPGTDDTYDLGSDTQRWRDLYLGPATLNIGTSNIDQGTIGYDTTTNNMMLGTTNGGVTVQNTTDTTGAFQIQNSAGTSNLFVADTTNSRIGIGTNTPQHALDVRSNANGARGVFFENNDVGSSASGYLLFGNDTGLVGGLAANSSTNTGRGGVNSLNLVNLAAANLTLGTSNIVQATIDAVGATTFKNSTDSASAFVIQDTAGDDLFRVDTTDGTINIGSSIPEVDEWVTSPHDLVLPPDPRDTNAIDFHSSTVATAEGYVYMIGGDPTYCRFTSFDEYCMTTSNTLYYAEINTDGTTGSWNTLGSLPADGGNATPRQALTYRDRFLYLVTSSANGGGFGTEYIYSAPVIGDGTIGSWTQQYSFSGATKSTWCGQYNTQGFSGDYELGCNFGLSVAGNGTTGGFGDGLLYIFIDGGDYAFTGFDGITMKFLLLDGGVLAPDGFGDPGMVDGTLASDIYNVSTGAGSPYINSVSIINDHLYVYNDAYSTDHRIWEVGLNTTTVPWAIDWPNMSGGAVIPQSGGCGTMTTSSTHVYIIDGCYMGDGNVQYAPINASTGDMGSWSFGDATSSINEINYYHSAFTYSGHLFSGGGKDYNTGFKGYQLFSAELNGVTGDAENWMVAGEMIEYNGPVSPATYGAAAVHISTSTYRLLGGNIDGAPSDQIACGGTPSPGTISGWGTGNCGSLPVPMQDAAAVQWNNRVYLIGGNGTSTAYYSGVNDTNFSSLAQTLPKTLYGASAVSANGRIFVAGGSSAAGVGGTISNTSYRSTINNTDGTLSLWSTTGNLPQPIAYAATALANDRMYIIGGHNGTDPVDTVYYGQTTTSGIFSWTTSSNPLPEAIYGAKAVVANGFIYVIGGHDDSGPVDTVYYAQVNSDGSTSAWQALNNLPDALYNASVSTRNGYIYVTGGHDGSGGTLKTYITATERMQTNITSNLGLTGDLSLQGVTSLQADSSTVLTLERTGTHGEGVLVDFRSRGFSQGTISVSGNTVSYNAFTGSHYALSSDNLSPGELVSQTGTSEYKEGSSEPIYNVHRSTSANDPSVFGSYFGQLEPSAPVSTENPELISAVGNGEMWVVENGSNLSAGDNLISSDTAGHAMKDTGEYAVSHIVAKVAENINWESVTDTVGGKKVKKITVVYSLYDKVSMQAPAEFESLTASTISADELTAGIATVESLTVEGLATVGELKVVGNATFEGNIIVEGHIVTAGDTPNYEVLEAVEDATIEIEGNDTSGTIIIKTSENTEPGALLKLLFAKSFDSTPQVVISPSNDDAGGTQIYKSSASKDEVIFKTKDTVPINKTLRYDYIILE